MCAEHLRKKFKTNAAVIECIDELVDHESEGGSDSTSQWTQLASRGGLVHVKDSTYRVFHAMELVVRQYFQRRHVTTLTTGTKVEMVGSITINEDVVFFWCLASVDMDTSTANQLLHAMVDLWVTIRGFSFCSGWMELYKQEAQKSLQRSKGLRKKYSQTIN